ncbi:MAG: hypothetical protein FGM24_02215 [Candidatus Kapabacteria bacterium]|nr:hypothetical protein [Candidatus Kapabacteria bacterium]
MPTRPPRRRRVEIYFVLYLAALVLLMPDGVRDKDAVSADVSTVRIDLQPERVRLLYDVVRDSGSSYIVRQADTMNVIRYSGNVRDIRLQAEIEDVETGARTQIDEASPADGLFWLVHDAARGAARFRWRPSALDPTDRTFRVRLTATAVPADDPLGSTQVRGTTEFVLAMAVEQRQTETVVRVESRVDTVVLREQALNQGQTFGTFWVAPARERIVDLPGRRWTNRLSFGGADVSRDLSSLPKVTASGSDGRAAQGVGVRTDDDGASILVEGISPTSGTLTVDVSAVRRDGRAAQTRFVVESTPLTALSVPVVMYPGIEYVLTTRLPDLPGSDVRAAVREGQIWRVQPTNAETVRFTPVAADTGKTVYLERYIDQQRVSQDAIRISSFDPPEIVDVRPYADGGKKLVVVRFFGGKENRPELQILEGNIGAVQKLHGNLAPASPGQRPTVTWTEQFVVTPKDAAKPFAFRIAARDKRGAVSRPWAEDR